MGIEGRNTVSAKDELRGHVLKTWGREQVLDLGTNTSPIVGANFPLLFVRAKR
jgi:hypothetical protein